jgi:hypothetical protein
MFLGPVNVRVLKKEDKLKIKDEYNNYRVRTLKILPQCRTERAYIYFFSDMISRAELTISSA